MAGRWRSGVLFTDGLLPEATTGARARPVVRLFVRWARRPLLPVVRLWRRNIQLRVVAATLLLSVAVVVVLGMVVTGQVRNGLLEAKERFAQSQAVGGFTFAQQAADNSGTRGPAEPDSPGAADGGQSAGTWMNNLVEQLASGGQGVYSVVVLGSRRDEPSIFGDSDARLTAARSSGHILPERTIPVICAGRWTPRTAPTSGTRRCTGSTAPPSRP